MASITPERRPAPVAMIRCVSAIGSHNMRARRSARLLAIVMPRLTRLLLLIGSTALIGAPVAQARTAPTQTLRLRVPVPAAGDFSVLTFELSIGGEGKHHRKQHLRLDLLNHREKGVFAFARLEPVRARPGRFLGVVEVFHRKSATAAALASGSAALLQASPFASAHAAGGAFDEFEVLARNERVIKAVIKNNIIGLSDSHKLGLDDFCDPLSLETYVLGEVLTGAAIILAGPVTGLPTGISKSRLADDAVEELCDRVEDTGELGPAADDEEELGEFEALFEEFLGIGQAGHTPISTYRVGSSAAWSFAGANEVRLIDTFTGAYRWSTPLSHAADSTNPVDAIKVVLPLAGTTARQVTNYICPTQLPTAAITTTNNANDTLTCSGGSLPLDQQFSLNVQSSPAPSSGMGGQLLAHQDGAYLAPFPISGP